MFRATALGPFDDVVAKATDENLTSEDWGAIIEVCDKVSGDPNGPKEAVQSMMKRLAHRNANVQLYTLELAHALCQNCGMPMHREVSSRAFTDALLRLASDRNTHNQVKAKILQKMKDWSDMFSKDADLDIMYDAYFRLKQSNPTLQAPSAPQKQGLTESDRQKEEEELQMALKLSLQEEKRKKATPASSGHQAGPSAPQQGAGAMPTVPGGTTAATVSRVRALYDFTPSEPGELVFKKGDVIAVLESVYRDWWRGSLKGQTGIFPLNYVDKLTDPTPDDLQREAHMEAEVFAEIKNVEKLLTLLSASNTAPREEDNEEISKLYHQTLAIRPKLIKLIEKYSQKKDDFTQLNEKFIKARRDYEALLESSMSQPAQHSYHQHPAYAMRPAPHGQGYAPSGGGGYELAGQPAHESQKYYHAAAGAQTGESAQQYQASGAAAASTVAQGGPAAPFYVAGAEVPSQAYPGRPQSPRTPVQGRQATSPPGQAYAAYGQPRPTSTYGAQELATSAYDSPVVAPQKPQLAGQAHDEAPQFHSYWAPDQPPPGLPVVAAAQAPAAQPGTAEPQYRPYVPAGGSGGAASAPSVPSDYY